MARPKLPFQVRGITRVLDVMADDSNASLRNDLDGAQTYNDVMENTPEDIYSIEVEDSLVPFSSDENLELLRAITEHAARKDCEYFRFTII